jgi:hypothetical protein
MKIERKWFGLVAIVAGSLAMAGGARAQQVPPGPPPPDSNVIYEALGPGPGPLGPDDAIAFVGFEGDLGGKTVTGAPFSASFTTQTTRVLADGNQIRRSTTGTLARDGQGRTRRDLTLPAIGPWAASGKTPPHVILINDTVAGAQFVLQPDSKIARKMQWPPRGRFRQGASPAGMPGWQGRTDVTTTSLGTQTINGVQADGTRYTRTIPAGQIGNEKPIVITTERWYSADLQTTVMTKRSDPRTAETVFQLTNIQRQEPDASLFQVPSDYTVKQGGPRAGNVLRRWRRQAPPPPPGSGPGQPPPPAQD